MTNRPVDARDLNLATGLIVTLALGCVAYAARARGIWLDEFWSLRLGALDRPFAAIVQERWLSDAHPPLANLLYRLVSLTGAEAIETRRLALNLPALLVLGAATMILTRPGGRGAFPVILVLLVLSLPGTPEAFADYRSYGWQITGFTVFLCYLRLLLDGDEKLPRSARAIGSAAIIAAIALHYVTGIIASITIGLAALALLRQRQWRAATRLLLPAALAWVAMIASGIILLGRMRRDMDVGWIVTTPATGALLFAFLFVTTLLANPLATWFAIRDRAWIAAPARSFPLVLTGALVLTTGALMLLNVLTPILIERYLIGWQLLICALIAVMAESALVASRTRFLAYTGIAILMLLIGTMHAASAGGWRQGQDMIAAEAKRCPATRVFAMSAWRPKTAYASNAARRETEVIDDAYRRLAHEGRFVVTVLDLATPAVLPVGTACPTILWVEHLGWKNVRDIAYLERAARLRFAGAGRIAMQPTGAGFILVARAP